MALANADIREEASRSRIYLWEIAEALGIRDQSLSRKLRRELPPEEKAKIREIIAKLRDSA